MKSYEEKRLQVKEKDLVEIKAEEKVDQLKAESELAMQRVRTHCIIAHDLLTGKPAYTISAGSSFNNKEGSPIPFGENICAEDGSTAQIYYINGDAKLHNIAAVSRDSLEEYIKYYQTYERANAYSQTTEAKP